MDIKKYEVLLKVIDYGSFTKAAGEFGYTQSGISHMIKALETEIGFPLLLRQRTGVLPTEDGKRIIPILRQLVNWHEQLNQAVALIQGVMAGNIRIGSFTSMSVHCLPRVLKEFQRDFPSVSIQIVEGGNQKISKCLEEGLIDIGFCSNQLTMEAEWIPLMDDSLMAVLPESFPVSAAASFPLENFNNTSFIALPRDFDYEVHSVFEKYDIHPHIQFSSIDDYTIISMIEQELGLSILPRLVLKGYKHCRVRTAELEPYCNRKLGIALLSKKCASPATLRFIEYAIRIISQEGH